MPPTPSLADLLTDLRSQLEYHRRRESSCAEQEAHFRDQRSYHAAELARIAACLETLQAAAALAQELVARPLPAEPPTVDLGSRSRPRLTRMVKQVIAEKPPSLPFGAKEVAAEVHRRFAPHLGKPPEVDHVSIALQRLVAAGRLRLLRRGRPHQEALYARDASPGGSTGA